MIVKSISSVRHFVSHTTTVNVLQTSLFAERCKQGCLHNEAGQSSRLPYEKGVDTQVYLHNEKKVGANLRVRPFYFG